MVQVELRLFGHAACDVGESNSRNLPGGQTHPQVNASLFQSIGRDNHDLHET